MKLRHILAIGCAAVVLFDAEVTHAQGRCDDADAIVSRTDALRREGNRIEAAAELEALLARCPSSYVRAQAGLAALSARLWYAAWQHLTRAFQADDDARVVENRATLLRALTRARSHLAALDPGAPGGGVELWIDGHLVGPVPLREPHVVPSGATTVELRQHGVSWNVTVTLAEGSVWRDEVRAPRSEPSLPPPLPVVEASPAAPAALSPTRRNVGIGLTVTGGLLVGASAVVWGMSSQWRDTARRDLEWRQFYGASADVASACAAANTTRWDAVGAARARELCAENDLYPPMAIALGAVGGAALVAGIIAWATAPTPARTSLQVSPRLGASSVGLTVDGTF